MLNGNCATLKVNGVPFQSADLATTQAVESGDQNRKFQLCAFNCLKQVLQFVRIKEYRLIVVLFRSINLFRYILRYEVGF